MVLLSDSSCNEVYYQMNWGFFMNQFHMTWQWYSVPKLDYISSYSGSVSRLTTLKWRIESHEWVIKKRQIQQEACYSDLMDITTQRNRSLYMCFIDQFHVSKVMSGTWVSTYSKVEQSTDQNTSGAIFKSSKEYALKHWLFCRGDDLQKEKDLETQEDCPSLRGNNCLRFELGFGDQNGTGYNLRHWLVAEVYDFWCFFVPASFWKLLMVYLTIITKGEYLEVTRRVYRSHLYATISIQLEHSSFSLLAVIKFTCSVYDDTYSHNGGSNLRRYWLLR